MLFDWLMWSSNEILLMVIGSCFNPFTPSSGVMSFLCVMSMGSFVASPLYSMFTHIFPRNLISFLFTSWDLFFSGCMSFWLYSFGLFGTIVTGDPMSIVKFWYFPSIFSLMPKLSFLSRSILLIWVICWISSGSLSSSSLCCFEVVDFVFLYCPFCCGTLSPSVLLCGSSYIPPSLRGICVVVTAESTVISRRFSKKNADYSSDFFFF